MTEHLLPWLRARLDDEEQNLMEIRRRRDYSAAETRLLDSLQAQVDSTRDLLDQVQEKPDDQGWLWLAKRQAARYANEPGYRQEWRPGPTAWS